MYEPSKCLQTFNVSGFQYYDGALVLDQLKPGTPVQLRSEPDNPHDADAVAIYHESTKLGYVPSSNNDLIALLLYYGHDAVCEARILATKPDEDPWNQVRVGVYVTDRREEA